jgi:hypothetical protein
MRALGTYLIDRVLFQSLFAACSSRFVYSINEVFLLFRNAAMCKPMVSEEACRLRSSFPSRCDERGVQTGWQATDWLN